MRRARWLILIAILVIAGAVFRTYTARIERIRKEAPAPAKPLEDNVDARSRDWVYVKTDSARGRDVVEVRAKNVRMIKEPSLTELEDVRLKLYHKDGKVYDYVTCARAMFDTAAKALVSEGEVQIAMGVELYPVYGDVMRTGEQCMGDFVPCHARETCFKRHTHSFF